MKQMMLIVRKDINDIFHNRAFFMILAIAAFLIFVLTSTFNESFHSLSAQGANAAEMYDTARAIISSFFLTMSFILMLMVTLYMNAYTVLLEKTKRVLESILCTPLTVKQFWTAKTLASFIPALGLGIILSLGTIIGLNIITVEETIGRWVLPDAAFLVAGLAAIVIVYLLSSIIIMLQLMMHNVRLIQTIFTALIFGSSFGLNYAFRFSHGTWMIVYITAAVAAALGIIVWFFSTRITKERIIMSSKG
jgi:hypothetical protein